MCVWKTSTHGNSHCAVCTLTDFVLLRLELRELTKIDSTDPFYGPIIN